MKSEPNLQEQVEKAVLKGAAWLDENEPGWFQRINIYELKMEQPCYCVLGQLYAGYVGKDGDNSATGFHYAVKHNQKDYGEYNNGEFAIDHGFDGALGTEAEYGMLDEAWDLLIRERQIMHDYQENAN